ncbi:DUF1343 domain-containing protein [Flavobacteriaceae bacterium]|jgi:uncharacterized protein YbbC (DUF1343 family)|nr:DUF1343 domain-containing protein [Flavobacteriaceae bacterium]|tara:strand:+ start:8550 stop:9758 length:1209 start_codon:yes stop_codon:yes gene_type:complete
MHLNFIKNTILLFVVVVLCFTNKSESQIQVHRNPGPIVLGAQQTERYLPILKNKNIGIVANQTSVIFKPEGYTHLIDTLLSLNIIIKKAFAPEHGFRGRADAGEYVKDGVDAGSGIPIVSLYGSNKIPNAAILSDLDVVIFDVQDVGARFYTFLSTLHYMMETCANLGITVLILDRPNPNGHYVDGPTLDLKYTSFVGVHPVPVVHGMTVGEYAQMINGEGWLKEGVKCELKVISIQNYTHSTIYQPPINPSPNLPNSKAINLYPSLCFFEGTNMSMGRGTANQFQIIGSPFLKGDLYNYEFIPKPNIGAKYPIHEGDICKGLNLQNEPRLNYIELKWLIDAYQNSSNKIVFFNPFFTKLAGQELLQKKIENGWNAQQIRASWKDDIEKYKRLREPYLLYPL